MTALRLRTSSFAMTALLASLTALGPASTDIYLPSIPAIARYFDTSAAHVQLSLSSYLFGFAGGQIFWGPISDRYGRKPVLMIALALFFISAVVCTFSQSMGFLIAARFFQGLAGSGPYVLTRAIVRDLYTGVLAGRQYALIAMMTGLAPALAPLGGGLLQQGFGWRPVFGAIAVVAGVVSLAAGLLLPETNAVKAREPFSLRETISGFGEIAATPVYRYYAGLQIIAYAGLLSFLANSSTVLQRQYGLSEVQFALCMLPCALAFAAGSGTASQIVRRVGIDGVIRAGVAILALSGVVQLAAVIFLPRDAISLVFGFGLWSLGMGLTMPQATAAAMAPFGARAGAASSLTGFMQMSSAAIIAAALAIPVEYSAVPLGLASCIGGFACLALILLGRPRRT